MRWTRWAGQSRLVQNVSLSPGSRVRGLPQLGHLVGISTLGRRRVRPGPLALTRRTLTRRTLTRRTRSHSRSPRLTLTRRTRSHSTRSPRCPRLSTLSSSASLSPTTGSTRRRSEHGPHHLRDHVSGLAHDDRVPGPHVFEGHLVLVVEGGERHGGAADEHRLEDCEWRRLAGPADGDGDVEQRGGPFLGRELVGDGPTGAWAVAPSRRWIDRSSTFSTTPSIS